MARAKKMSAPKYGRYVRQGVYIFPIAAVLLMILPVITALSAGIAALSVVIFGGSLILIIPTFIYRRKSDRALAVAALIAAVFGLVFPQIIFCITAQRENVSLRFNPLSYMHFSGSTTLQPARLINYKSIGNETLELAHYPTERSGVRPAVIVLHGGGWRYGNHLETGDWPRVLTEAGFHVFSVEYSLAGDTYPTWRDAPRDVHDAYNYVQANAKGLSVDPSQISLLGQSAGGHLALLEAYLHNYARSVVALYAPIDLTLDYATSRDKSAELDFIGGPPKQYPHRYRAVSPITYVSPYTPRTLLVQGKTDDLVDSSNTTLLAGKLTENRIEHETVFLPMTGHSFENQRGGFATQITEAQVVRFLLE